ncbi:MarR family transcriptional regulator [Haloechinothrix sp. LS1_15]|uniref:MarR family winged helix-turn-helix transcriptional regulator n=1 Tax=Haloechinothrix sp. LS1_15 TaxID=2652248 RepID=UPI0029483435|nr:MarR family transcriptional regulator [Haloechinothrix sp. LS1_15]MDV6013336.1 MarR family transcriptional regulator [Haloechinothrix sp. LS1_15]
MDEGVRWLSQDEQRVWRRLLDAISMLTEHIERRTQQDAGMPASYYEVLVVLSEAPDHTLRMSELASRSRFSRSRLSHAVTKLEAKGWVLRTSCPTDKRGALATLSDEGMTVLRAAAPHHVEAVREAVFDALSEEQVRKLGEIAGTIADGLADTCAAAEAEAAEGDEPGEQAERAGDERGHSARR